MTSTEHTPGPWDCDLDYIVAPDPTGRHPDIYIAEVADNDEEGRVAPLEQQLANRQLITAAPALLAACRMVVARWEHGDLAEAARACSDAIALAEADLTIIRTDDGVAVTVNPKAGLAGLPTAPAAPKLLASLKAILSYAESEAYSLEKLKDSPEAEAEADRAWKAAETAQAVIAEAEAAGIEPSPPGNPSAEKPYSVLLLYPDYADDTGYETYYAFVEAADPIDAVAVARRQASAAQEGTEIEPGDFHPLLVTQGHRYGQPLFDK